MEESERGAPAVGHDCFLCFFFLLLSFFRADGCFFCFAFAFVSLQTGRGKGGKGLGKGGAKRHRKILRDNSTNDK